MQIRRVAREKQEKEDIFETFRRDALRNEKVLKGRMSIHPDFAMNNDQTAIFKMAMVKLLSETLSVFEELNKNKVEHNDMNWLEDPTTLSWLKRIFQDYMIVEGVQASLQPWSKPAPDPVLTVEKAPLRLLVRGGTHLWTIGQIEDLRELSAGQWHEPMDLDDDDWLVTIFGSDVQKEQETSSTSSSSRPVPALQDRQAADGDQQDQGDPEGELVPLEPPEMEVEDDDQPAVNPGALRPCYDFRRVFRRLPRMDLHAQTSNLEVYLHLEEGQMHPGGHLPFFMANQLYDVHAPQFPNAFR